MAGDLAAQSLIPDDAERAGGHHFLKSQIGLINIDGTRHDADGRLLLFVRMAHMTLTEIVNQTDWMKSICSRNLLLEYVSITSNQLRAIRDSFSQPISGSHLVACNRHSDPCAGDNNHGKRHVRDKPEIGGSNPAHSFQ